MYIHKIGQHLLVGLDDGREFSKEDCTDEFFKKVLAVGEDSEALIGLFYPEYTATKVFVDDINKSSLLTMEGNSVYIKSICELTLPQDFAEKIIEAEKNGDTEKLTAYLNFWTLLSLNPDSRVRNNLFWFLNRWNITLSKSGLIVAYRNADIVTEGTQFNQTLTKFVTQEYVGRRYKYKDNTLGSIDDTWVVMQDNVFDVCQEEDLDASPDTVIIGKLTELYETLTKDNTAKTTVYTDHHSNTFRIRLGHIVSMPREECDSNQHNTCSRGLHCAAKNWLQNNYFGQVGMKVLVNPADVVAVPPEDNYGKMRTCAYYPVSIVDYDECGHIIDEDLENGFEDDFMSKICYTGNINNEDNDNYKLNIPETAEVDREKIYLRLKNIAANIVREV